MKNYIERLLSGLRRLNTSPRYIAPHHCKGLRNGESAEWDEPEMVQGHGRHLPMKKGEVKDIRHVPDDLLASFAELDAERETLNKRLAELRGIEANLIQAAFEKGKPVTLSDILDSAK